MKYGMKISFENGISLITRGFQLEKLFENEKTTEHFQAFNLFLRVTEILLMIIERMQIHSSTAIMKERKE